MTGDAVLRVGDVSVSENAGQFDQFNFDYTLTAPISFNIRLGISRIEAVSVGPYYGTLTVQGIYFQDTPLGDYPAFITGGTWGSMNNLFEVRGVTVPEPSSVLLMATVMLGLLGGTLKRTVSARIF